MGLDLILLLYSVDDCAVNSEIQKCVVEWQYELPLAESDRQYMESAEKAS